jgi:CheY-like chemotaxis protein
MMLSGARVLVVDDELELLDIFAAWLRRSGCKVFTAANGAEALKVLEVERVDALISDLRMPIVDGVALVRRIYEIGLVIPSMLFVSAFGDVNVREIHALGVERLIEKPLRRQDLLGALEQSLQEREERWVTPMTEPVERSIAIDMEGLDKATEALTFQLGRGGCRFLCLQPVIAGEKIELAIHIPDEDITVHMQSDVRWYSDAEKQAGVEFHYLEPAGRSWVVGRINSEAPRSFIPGL